jgi:hypothetical protein
MAKYFFVDDCDDRMHLCVELPPHLCRSKKRMIVLASRTLEGTWSLTDSRFAETPSGRAHEICELRVAEPYMSVYPAAKDELEAVARQTGVCLKKLDFVETVHPGLGI